MTALSAERKVPRLGPEGRTRTFPMAAQEILNGAIVMLNSSGYAANAIAGTATLPIVGIAEETVDNSAGAAGDLEIRVKTGIYGFALDGTNTPTDAMVGDIVFAEDNQTAASTNTGSRPALGYLHQIDGTVAYVEVPGRTLV